MDSSSLTWDLSWKLFFAETLAILLQCEIFPCTYMTSCSKRLCYCIGCFENKWSRSHFTLPVQFWTQEVLLKGWCRGRIQVRAMVVSVWVGEYKRSVTVEANFPAWDSLSICIFLSVVWSSRGRNGLKGMHVGESVFQMARVFWKLTPELNP